MEQAIFGLASIIHLCIFLALWVLPFYLSNKLGSLIDTRIRNFGFNRLFPTLLLLVAVTWGYATYAVFKRDCDLMPKPIVSITKPQRPDGFSFYNNSSFQPAAGYRWEPALARGYFKYIDFAEPKLFIKKDRDAEFDYSKYDDFSFRRACGGKVISVKPRIVEINNSRSCGPFKAIPNAKTIVAILPERASNYWWNPPIYELDIQVKDLSSGQVIASATDLVIGGGLVGALLRVIGGDQDYKFLSCGYASPNIGPWRPSLASRPRYSQYEKADTNFVVNSFSEN